MAGLKEMLREASRWWEDTNAQRYEDVPNKGGVLAGSPYRLASTRTPKLDITPSDVLQNAVEIPLGVLGTLASYSPDAEAGVKVKSGKGATGAVQKAGTAIKRAAGFANDPVYTGAVVQELRKPKGPANVTREQMRGMVPQGEEDIARSFGADPRFKGGKRVPRTEIETALANRARYRDEPNVLPKPADQMSPEEWIDWGKQYGVDMSVTPSQSLGVSDIATRKELMVPGGLEGKFTIPDLFQIKANNFDPTVLGQEGHNALMQKFLRSYDRAGAGDAVDTFNDFNFSLLSPNAPLTQNQFLAQRFRARTPEDLEALAARQGEPDVAAAIDAESGVGAASRGGFGVKGTANLGYQADLAALLRQKPEMFHPGEGETLRDVGFRVMNQVPGLSVKTASLGVPWTDLARANTSAVDLHMIRHGYKRLMEENPDFAARMAALREANPGLTEEKAAINIISDHPEAVYRLRSGELHPDLPSYLDPAKLATEPAKFVRPSPFYLDIMRQVDESRGPSPELELFPEQWRKWDGYRGRVEPHEQAHPDFRKLPKMSFTELQRAYQAHKDAGYIGTKGVTDTDWRKLYYGRASLPAMVGLGTAAAGGAGGLSAYESMKERERQRQLRMQQIEQEQNPPQ